MFNQNQAFIISLFILVLISILVINISAAIIFHIKNKKYLINLEKYKVHTNADIDEAIPKLLELIIKECFNDYLFMNLARLSSSGYIKEDAEKQIRSELVGMVTDRLSPATIDKLSLYYNPKHIGDIIGDKIYITVMNFVITENSKYEVKETMQEQKIKSAVVNGFGPI